MTHASRHTLAAASFLIGCAIASAPSTASAQSIIKSPGDHPDYHVELEPHAVLGWGHLYHGRGLGLGVRFTIPIVQNGFVKSINNNVGISFGVDWLRYSDCYYYDNSRYGYGCGASYFTFPVVMQWNFWLTPKWSVFGEPGLYVYHGLYDDYCDYPGRERDRYCGYPDRTGVNLALFLGGRFHFNDKVSLTMRIGFPSVSFGGSFFL